MLTNNLASPPLAQEVQRAKEGATIESQLARADATYKQEDAAMQARLQRRARALLNACSCCLRPAGTP